MFMVLGFSNLIRSARFILRAHLASAKFAVKFTRNVNACPEPAEGLRYKPYIEEFFHQLFLTISEIRVFKKG